MTGIYTVWWEFNSDLHCFFFSNNMTAHTYQFKLWAVQDISYNYRACGTLCYSIEETSALRSDASVDVEDEVDGVAESEITCEVRFTISLLAY